MSMLDDVIELRRLGLANAADESLERDIQAALADVDGVLTAAEARAISDRLIELRDLRRPAVVKAVDVLRMARVAA